MDVSFIELWVVLSFAAAGFQTLRFMLQKVLSTKILSPTGATFARFVYSAPIVAMATLIYVRWTGQSVWVPNGVFWLFAAMGGVAQVLATVCVVTIFKSRNFAVGVTLMKTEVILSVFVGLVLLGEGVGPAAFVAISMGVVGVLLLSKTPKTVGWSQFWDPSVGLGLASGLLFAISAVSYRGASLEVASSDAAFRAAVTLAAVTMMQMIGMALWLRVRDPGQIVAVWQARRVAVWIGLMSLAGSFCWFYAFTLQSAAFVKAVGQVELILSLIASTLIFGERISRRELTGVAVLGGSILLLVLVL